MKKFFWILIVTLFHQVGFGQPTFSIDDVDAPYGTEICLDITVVDFNNIVEFQFSLLWNPTTLDFQNVQNINVPNLSVNQFDWTNTASGKLAVSGVIGLDEPVTLADGTSIFQICFNTITPCSTNAIEFTNDPWEIEVIDNLSNPVNIGANLNNGSVNVGLIQSLPSDTTLCFGDFLQLDLEVAPTTTDIQWSSANGYLEFTCTDCLQPTVTFNGNNPFGQSSDMAIVTVSNDEGCEETASIELSTSWYVDMFPAEPIRYFCEGDDISFANEDLLIGPYVYHWTGPNNFVDTQIFPTIFNATLEDAGTYNVQVTDFNGCGFSLQFEVLPTIQISIEEVIPESCLGNQDGSITVDIQGGEGDLEFIWSHSVSTPYTVSNLQAGPYSLTITDGNGCVGMLESITVGTGLVVDITSDTIICGGESLQLEVVAPNAVSYQWFSLEPLSCTDCPNPFVESPFLDDSYIVEVSGANGCVETAEVNVQVRQYLDFGLLQFSNSPLCEGDTLFFEPNLFNAQSYEWTGPGNFNATVSHPFIPHFGEGNEGTYNLEIIDDAGCMTGASFDVQLIDELSVAFNKMEPSCFGNCDGSIQVSALGSTPPYTYTWSDGFIGSIRTDLCAGDYEITATSANCSAVASVTLSEPPALDLIYEVTKNASCLGGGGMITIWVTGGTLPYWVDWGFGPVENGSILADLSAGFYSITITDANGCAIVSPTVEVTDNPIYSISEDILICEGESAPLQVEAPFGTEINWEPAIGLDDPASFTPIAAPSATTTYTATVMDGDGCTGSASVTVFVGNDNCIWVNRDTIPVGESGEWCDPTLGPLGLEITEVTCGPEGFVDFLINDPANCYQYTGLSAGQDSICMTLCYTGTADCFEALLLVVVEDDPVWPGDTDSDGFANHFDVLNIGLGFGALGPSRPDATLNWVEQTAPDWPQYTPISAINYKHIDTNGDGLIDVQDTTAINLNWGFEHDFRPQEPIERNALIPFYVQPDTLIEGAVMSLPIILGDSNTPAEDIYGLGFSLIYDPDIIVPGSTQIDFAESWIGSWGEDAIAMQKDFHPEGRIDVGLTRIDGTNVSGSGTIGHLIITIEDDILLLQPENNLLNDQSTFFDIQNVRLINFNEEAISVNTSPTESEIVTSSNQIPLFSQIRIFPNPARDQFYIESPEVEWERIEVLDINGRIIKSVIPKGPLTPFSTQELSNGVYLIRALSKKGLHGNRVIIQKE